MGNSLKNNKTQNNKTGSKHHCQATCSAGQQVTRDHSQAPALHQAAAWSEALFWSLAFWSLALWPLTGISSALS
ncbi:hypothetical protein CCR91_19555 [Thiorhodovibrio winogradskyi]|nr:hypothetical protein [Thiorhodovibrio winogradskyi]